jgi:hypothetical protein
VAGEVIYGLITVIHSQRIALASDLDGRDARCRVCTFVPGGRQGGQPTVNLEESCVLKIKGTREK